MNPIKIPKPFQDENDHVTEDAKAYTLRVKDVLPDMPDDVIEQWLFSHPDVIDEWDWLELSTLNFTLEEWETCDFPALDKEQDECVHTYRCRLDEIEPHKYSKRRAKIFEYFVEHKTWPRYPIMLENLNGEHVRPGGWECRTPHQLLEGNNRFAMFTYFRDLKQLCDKHHIWVVRKSTP
jgi:hypothetical protein